MTDETQDDQKKMSEEQNKNQGNPLAKYFRQPGISIELPSKYYFYKQSPRTNMLNEIEVYPMTAQDELILKNPDNLLSGEALEKVIKSCAPSITNVRELLQPDVEALLLAIRAVSYGDNMEVVATCPKCETENTFQINVRQALEEMNYIQDKHEVELSNNLKVELKPYDFEDTTKASILAFQEARALDAGADTSVDEETRQQRFQEAFHRLSELNMDLLVKSIHKIRTPETTVEKQEWIREWVNQADRKDISKIEDQISEMNKTGANKTLNARCQNSKCLHEWQTQITYDPANFFG